ncbi:MAG: D-alanyl-D-alanine carboxypeptidase family protein [Pseudomonadota bacterium]
MMKRSGAFFEQLERLKWTVCRLFLPLVAVVLVAGCSTTQTLSLSASPYSIPSARYAAVVVDGGTGKILHDTRANAIRFPASLTKMMTMYMAFDALSAGRVTKKTRIPVSSRAAAQEPSKLWLKAGSTIDMDTALRALAVKSANDVAVAVAEKLGGTEAKFARMMTAKARALGMSSTTFKNASGLPNKQQVTTARDMAKLGMALRRNHSRYFGYFGLRSFTYRGRKVTGHNRVLGRLRGANGIKTGYTRASGFNLVTSVTSGSTPLIGVILGENSAASRDKHMVQLLSQHGAKPR